MQFLKDSMDPGVIMTSQVSITSNGTRTSSSEATLRLYSKWRTHISSKLLLQKSIWSAVYLVSISWVVDNSGLRLLIWEDQQSEERSVRNEMVLGRTCYKKVFSNKGKEPRKVRKEVEEIHIIAIWGNACQY